MPYARLGMPVSADEKMNGQVGVDEFPVFVEMTF